MGNRVYTSKYHEFILQLISIWTNPAHWHTFEAHNKIELHYMHGYLVPKVNIARGVSWFRHSMMMHTGMHHHVVICIQGGSDLINSDKAGYIIMIATTSYRTLHPSMWLIIEINDILICHQFYRMIYYSLSLLSVCKISLLDGKIPKHVVSSSLVTLSSTYIFPSDALPFKCGI